MQDSDLFLSLAEIAGVFIGFGALIAVRGSASEDRSALLEIRWVMSTAIWVAIVALAPVFVSRYGAGGHELWLGCSLLALVLLAVIVAVNARAPENMADVAATLVATPRAKIVLVMGPTFWLPTVSLVLALAVVVLGAFSDKEEALYLTAAGLGLFMGAMGLFRAVFWRGSPATA